MDFADLFLCRIFCLEANYHYTTRYMTLGQKFYRPVVWSISHHPSKQLWVLLSQNLSFFTGNLSRQVPGSRKFKMSQKKMTGPEDSPGHFGHTLQKQVRGEAKSVGKLSPWGS